jgi:hypothetical protein
LMLRRDVVAREVGWEEDWPGGERVINAGYNRVGIEGGEVDLCGQGGWVRGRAGETYLWREKERRKGFKRWVVIARASLTMKNGGEWHCCMQ